MIPDPSRPPSIPNPPPLLETSWEYRRISIEDGKRTEEQLNDMGARGWELVSAIQHSANDHIGLIFKRRKRS